MQEDNGCSRCSQLCTALAGEAVPCGTGTSRQPLPWPWHAGHPPHWCPREGLAADGCQEERRGFWSLVTTTHLCRGGLSCHPQVLVVTALLKVVLAQSHCGLAWHLPSSCNQDINCWSFYMVTFIKSEKQCLDRTFPSGTLFLKAISQTVF